MARDTGCLYGDDCALCQQRRLDAQAEREAYLQLQREIADLIEKGLEL